MFYELMMNRTGVPPEGRGQLKKDIFKEVFYGTGRDGMGWEDTPLRKAFVQSYPNVWKLIRRYKKGNYRRLAWAMQRAESRLMIDAVCYRLATEFPNVPIITIHDSIMTTYQYVPLISQLISEEFGIAGLRPTIKTTSYSREIAEAA